MWIGFGLAALYGLLGIILCIFGYKLFDWVEFKIDFADEIRKGHIAVAIMVGGFLIGICIIIGRAVGS